MADWVRVCAEGEIPDGQAQVVPADLTGHDDDIAVFYSDSHYYALDDTCSHDRASLSEGWVEDGEVECPLHAARFCLADGAVMCMPAVKPVRAHNLDVRDGAVFVQAAQPA